MLAFFEKLPPLPGRHRGLCLVTPLVAQSCKPSGHSVPQLMPPAYVKPYVKQQEERLLANAESNLSRCGLQGPICGSCCFRPLEQQSGLVLHRTRHLFIRQQTSWDQ